MDEGSLENHISEALTGDAQNLALDFAAYLRAQEMQFERGTGYWADKRYFMIKHKNEYVCFILVNGYGPVRHKDEPEGWIIWSNTSDLSDSQWYESAPLAERAKEIALRNVDFCANCSPGSPCYGGMRKIIFGRELNHVCRTTFRFDNPDTETLECVKKLVDIRKADIDGAGTCR